MARASARPRSRSLAAFFSASAIALLAVFAATLAAQVPAGTIQKDDPFQRVSDKLICQCGCNYVLSHCPHLQCPSAPVMRAAIKEKLAAGLSEDETLQAMVAQFGLAALAAPPAEGFNLTAWVMPFVALLLGLWLAIVVARRWLRKPPTPAASAEVVSRYRRALEREMKQLEE